MSPRQVLIDAKIYEVDLTGQLSAGVEAFLQAKGGTNPAGLTQTLLTASSNSALALSAGTMVGQARQLFAALNANEIVTKVKVLSSPSVIATDSIPAYITVGSTVPTLSSQAVNPGVTSGGNSLFTNTVSNVSTGTGLNILARVNPSGIVTMVIDQSVTAPQPMSSNSSSTINSPSFSQREVSTQVTVDDGDMIAIGGIINDNHTDSITGIPFLDRLPYLGFLFGEKNTTTSRTELIVFLTPRVIYDTHHISDATEELRGPDEGTQTNHQTESVMHPQAGKRRGSRSLLRRCPHKPRPAPQRQCRSDRAAATSRWSSIACAFHSALCSILMDCAAFAMPQVSVSSTRLVLTISRLFNPC